MDRDHNGKVSRKELKESMNSCIGLISDHEIDAMLSDADTNRDGSLDRNELLSVLKRYQMAASSFKNNT